MTVLDRVRTFFAKSEEPDIIKSATRFKRIVTRQNDAAMREMAHTYGKIYNRLRDQLAEVTKLVDEAQAEGKKAVLRKPGSGAKLAEDEYSANWLFKQRRYQELMYQVENELLYYSRYAAAMVVDQQNKALRFGQEHAQALMSESLGDPDGAGVVVTWNRVPHEALQNLAGFLSDGSPLAYKFAGLPAEVADGIKETMLSGIAMGWGPRRMAQELKRAFNGGLSNSLLVCRTETMRAYREASHQSYVANDHVVKGWIWAAAHSARTCAGCWAMDGTFHKLDERLTDHPGGRCTAIPVTKSWEEITDGKVKGVKDTAKKPWNSEDLFRKLTVAEQIQVLGPARYRLWRDGKIKLGDLVAKERSKVWGDHYRPKSIKELVTDGEISPEDAKAARAIRPYRARRFKTISEALLFPGQMNIVLDAAKEVATIIDTVHKSDGLPRIRINYGPAGSGTAYGHYDRPGLPTEIMMGNYQGIKHDHPMLTAAHEIGHFLDDQGIGRPGVMASRTKALDNWRDAIHNTDAVKRLKALQAATIGVDPGFAKRLSYLLSEEEMFARSYAQYIAEKSRNIKMLAEIESMLEHRGESLKQWTASDFKPVKNAFDKLFKELQWQKK